MSKSMTTCPHCGASYDLVQHLAEGDLRDYVVALSTLPPELRPTARAYIELWRATPGATLQMGRRARIAAELARLWAKGVFEAGGNYYEIDRADIAKSLEMAVAANPSGLNNHNYLKKIMRERARAAAGKAEARREADRRAGLHRSQAEPEPPAQTTGQERRLDQWTAEECAAALMNLWAKPGAYQLMAGMAAALEDRLSELGVDAVELRRQAALQPGATPAALLAHCQQGRQ